MKKNLIPNQTDEILHLLKEKISILDKLIIEAKIYKNETDPLIEKDFYNLPSGFVSKYSRSQSSIATATDTSSLVKKKKKKTGYLNVSSNKIGGSSPYLSNSTRKVFGIDMRKKLVIPTSFENHINYSYILGYAAKVLVNRNRDIQQKELFKLIDKDTQNTVQPLALELLDKYLEFISLVSKNDTRKDITEKLRRNSLKGHPVKKWFIGTPLIVFELPISKSNPFFEKKNYDLSEALSNQFNAYQASAEINLTSQPSYYINRRIGKTLQCIETARDIKYKSRICINPIDIDKDIYFDHGTFETRENNFLNVNKKLFESLHELDKKLEEASRKYVKFFILELMSPTPDKNVKINLEGGL